MLMGQSSPEFAGASIGTGWIGLATTLLKLRTLSFSIPLRMAGGKGWELAQACTAQLVLRELTLPDTRTYWGRHRSYQEF